MADTLDPKHPDKRTAERYIKSGLLDEKGHEKYLKGLPDLTDKSDPVDTRMLDEDFDDEEEDDEDEADEAEEATDKE